LHVKVIMFFYIFYCCIRNTLPSNDEPVAENKIDMFYLANTYVEFISTFSILTALKKTVYKQTYRPRKLALITCCVKVNRLL